MTLAQTAITIINAHKMQLPEKRLLPLARILGRAAMQNDQDAINYLFLLNWKPQQRVN